MFTVPTLDDMHQLLIALLGRLLPGVSTTRTSTATLWQRTAAAAATDVHAHVDSALADLLPDTAQGAALDRWGAIVGRPRKGATPARKADALRLVNTTGAGVGYTAGAALYHVSGLRFEIAETGTVPADGTKDVDLVAIDTGAATRLAAGEVLTFETPIAGLEEQAVLVLDVDEDGVDQESDGDYRARLLARFADPPLGGADADYEHWALSSAASIASAYVLANRSALGTVDVVALHTGTGTARFLSSGERTALLAYLTARRPSGATVRVLETLAQSVSVEVLVASTGEEAYTWDWDDTTAPVVSAWNGTTRTLTFSTDRPTSLEAGDRLVIKKADGTGAGEVLTVESLSSTNAVVLQAAPTVAPVALDTVYAAGPLTVAVRDAILAHVDALGPANTDGIYGTWPGSLLRSALYGVCRVPGVRDLDVVTPASASVDPTDPPVPGDHQIYVLVPGRVIVRRL